MKRTLSSLLLLGLPAVPKIDDLDDIASLAIGQDVWRDDQSPRAGCGGTWSVLGELQEALASSIDALAQTLRRSWIPIR